MTEEWTLKYFWNDVTHSYPIQERDKAPQETAHAFLSFLEVLESTYRCCFFRGRWHSDSSCRQRQANNWTEQLGCWKLATVSARQQPLATRPPLPPHPEEPSYLPQVGLGPATRAEELEEVVTAVARVPAALGSPGTWDPASGTLQPLQGQGGTQDSPVAHTASSCRLTPGGLRMGTPLELNLQARSRRWGRG